MNCCQLRHNPKQGGFGLLEALVALVLLSSVGFTLLAWVQQNLDTLHRLRLFYSELEARRTVAEWSRSINPMTRPTGEINVGAFRLKWNSTPNTDLVSQRGYPAGMGLHDLALYDVTVLVYHRNEQSVWFEEKIISVGFKKVREFRLPFQGM